MQEDKDPGAFTATLGLAAFVVITLIIAVLLSMKYNWLAFLWLIICGLSFFPYGFDISLKIGEVLSTIFMACLAVALAPLFILLCIILMGGKIIGKL